MGRGGGEATGTCSKLCASHNQDMNRSEQQEIKKTGRAFFLPPLPSPRGIRGHDCMPCSLQGITHGAIFFFRAKRKRGGLRDGGSRPVSRQKASGPRPGPSVIGSQSRWFRERQARDPETSTDGLLLPYSGQLYIFNIMYFFSTPPPPARNPEHVPISRSGDK